MSKARAVRRTLDVFVDETLSPEARSDFLADTARQALASAIATGEASDKYRLLVDGREGQKEEAVRPDGKILYLFSYLGEVAAFALAYLRARSPTGLTSGNRLYREAYGDSFYMGLGTGAEGGGRFIMARNFNPETMGADVTEITIGNIQPYSRKLDVQLVGGRRLRFSVPPNLFEGAATAVKARYGNMVTAKRYYTMRFPRQYTLRTGRRAGKPVESPALIITLR